MRSLLTSWLLSLNVVDVSLYLSSRGEKTRAKKVTVNINADRMRDEHLASRSHPADKHHTIERATPKTIIVNVPAPIPSTNEDFAIVIGMTVGAIEGSTVGEKLVGLAEGVCALTINTCHIITTTHTTINLSDFFMSIAEKGARRTEQPLEIFLFRKCF